MMESPNWRSRDIAYDSETPNVMAWIMSSLYSGTVVGLILQPLLMM